MSATPASAGMDDFTHRYLHLTRGTQVQSGLLASGYTLDTNGNAALSYGISSGVTYDEDLVNTIGAFADGGPYRIAFRSGSDANLEWDWSDTSVSGILDNGANITYNQNNAGTWQQTAITANNRWVNYFVAAIQTLQGPQSLSFKAKVYIHR